MGNTLVIDKTITPQHEMDMLTNFVSQIMHIEDITYGESQKSYIARYRGRLSQESVNAYDQLSKNLDPLNITPLFRKEGETHLIILVDGRVRPKPSNPVINLVLFLFTVLSVLFAGSIYVYQGPVTSDLWELLKNLLYNLGDGFPFAISLLTILVFHEFGHYLAGRYHKTHVTLPYFLPFPLSPFGTLGAFIQLKETPKNKRDLLDIGIAGPIAGLVIAIPILLYGLSLSTIQPIAVEAGQGIQLEGNSLLYLLAKYIVFGKLLPAPLNYTGINPIIYWVRYFFTSKPYPIGGIDVFINPIAWAGWAGLLVTALNLIPAGQLDGGHIIFSLLGKKAKIFFPFILVGLFLLGFAWNGWWFWAVLLLFLGRFYAEPLDQITELNRGRKILAVLGLFIFVLVFTPVPLIQVFIGN